MESFTLKPFRWFTVGALVLAHLACSPVQQSGANLAEEKLMDVKYGPYERNLMDVYLPAHRGDSTPFVLLIHGGGWVGYGKENIREYQDILLANGIAVASINHRYANDSTIHYQEMVADGEAALDYCADHAEQWHTRNNYFAVTGVSSGGHLALMTGYLSPQKINAIVEFSAPTNVADTALLNYTRRVGLLDLIQKMTGKVYQTNTRPDDAYFEASPVNHVKKEIPVLIIHGDADPVVPYVQALELNQKLESAGAVHKLVTLPNAGHSLQPQDSVLRDTMYSEAVNWILKYGTPWY